MARVSATNPPVFEHKVCGRCGGSGRYSYNQMDGDRCYGCLGTTWQLTKRGAAAQRYLNEMRCVPADTLKVGDMMQVEELVGFTGATLRYFAAIVEIKDATGCAWSVGPGGEKIVHPMIELSTEHPKRGRSGLVCGPKTSIRRGWSAEEKREQVQAALAYQASLTATGAPRRRA